MNADILTKAALVDNAAASATAIKQLSQKQAITLEEAYQIQKASINRRLERGEKLVGLKMGFTSRAKMIQMGVDDLIWGRLTDAMLLEEGGELDMRRFIHPRIEPEIAYLIKKTLAGKVTPVQAMSCVEAVAPAMEVIDSRYEHFKFSLEDVVADNSSSSGFVVGKWHKPDLDISNLGMIMQFDGKIVEIGSSAAILGDPIRSLVAAARVAAEAGETIEPGWIVMAGAATAAQAITPGTYMRTLVEKLGAVSITSSAEKS